MGGYVKKDCIMPALRGQPARRVCGVCELYVARTRFWMAVQGGHDGGFILWNLSDNIRQQHALELRDRVFQEQLALLQALQAQEVDGGGVAELLENDVEVTMLGLELVHHFLDVFFVFLQHRIRNSPFLRLS